MPTRASLLALSLFSSIPALAARPLVVCGGAAGSASVELDNLTVVRGGNFENQVVLRDSAIIEDFLSKQAIYGGELNAKGEFLVRGLPSTNSVSPRSLYGSVNNRHVHFLPNGGTSYTLTISYTDSSFQEITLANFTFNDCRSS